MEKTASLTALMAAFARAYHNENAKKPVFADGVVRRLLTDEEYRRIGGYIVGGADFFTQGETRRFAGERALLEWVVNTQLAPTPLARARYCEDSLRTAVLTGTTQYVILGAGLDTFAWREPELMSRLTVFEVDKAATQSDKLARLRRAKLGVPERLRFVSADLADGDLREQLAQSGFDEGAKTFFSLLGVSYYLSADELSALAASVAAFAAEGSTLLLDYADGGLFSAKERRVQNMTAMAAVGGEPMRFCADERELEELLLRSGFLIYESLSPSDIDALCFGGRDDGFTAFEHINYALCVLKGAQLTGTKEKLLQTALRLFSQRGYEAVSVKDIADELFITKGALYRHYASKRAIFESIVERVGRLYDERERRLCATTAEVAPAEGLRRRVNARFRFWTEETEPARFRRMLTLERYHDEEAAALYRRFFADGAVGGLTRELLPLAGDAETAGRLAIELYAPLFYWLGAYDDAEGKRAVSALAAAHTERFTAKLAAGRRAR